MTAFQRQYPISEKDSTLRKMVLDKYAPAPNQPRDVEEKKLALLMKEWRALAGYDSLPPELARWSDQSSQ